MIKKLTFKKFYNIYLAIFAGLMIFFPRMVSIAILPIFIFVVYGLINKLIRLRFSWLALIFTLLYLLYLIGLVYTENPSLANKYLEYKLSFVVFPLLLSFRFRDGYFSIPIIASGMIVGVIFSIFYGFFNAFICSMSSSEMSCFMSVLISPVHHPTYFMSFVLFAMVASWFGFLKKWKGCSLKWIIPFTILGIVVHILSLSLAGFLFLMITISIIFIYVITKKWGRKFGAFSILWFTFIGYLIVNYAPQIEGEWNNAKWYANEYLKNPIKFVKGRDFPMSGSEQRLVMWTISWEELKSKPMGSGTGNLDDRLGDRLRELGQFELADLKLNPHNQYLQTGVEIGVFGLFLLLLLIGYGIFKGIRDKNPLLLLLILGLAFNCLFESILQRQSGIVFFTFWICLLMFNIKRTNSL